MRFLPLKVLQISLRVVAPLHMHRTEAMHVHFGILNPPPMPPLVLSSSVHRGARVQKASVRRWGDVHERVIEHQRSLSIS